LMSYLSLFVFVMIILFSCNQGASRVWSSLFYQATDDTPFQYITPNPTQEGELPTQGGYGALAELQKPFTFFRKSYQSIHPSQNGLLNFLHTNGYYSYLNDHRGCNTLSEPAEGAFDDDPNFFVGINVFSSGGGQGGAYFSLYIQFHEVCPRPSQASPDESCTIISWHLPVLPFHGRYSEVHTFVQFQLILYHTSQEFVTQYESVGTEPSEVGVWYAGDDQASMPIFCSPTNVSESLGLKGKAIRFSPLNPSHPSSFPSLSKVQRPSPPPVRTTTGRR